MPYRIDLRHPPERALEALIEIGALDVEAVDGGVAALMPDAIAPDVVRAALGVQGLTVSPALGRDDDSVWRLSARPVRVAGLELSPAGTPAAPGALVLTDGPAFGTGLHATTALCLEAIEGLTSAERPARMLDIGTGSGILALAALRRGVARATGLDVDAVALRVAAENARLNSLADRLSLVLGGPEAVRGAWPLVAANIRAAELMELAPVLVRRIASGGWLVLSGIPQSVTDDVERSYRRLGMAAGRCVVRDGWAMLVLRASW